MTKKQDVIFASIFYSLQLLWATVFTATMWRLNVLHGPHWLKLCYLALCSAWLPVTVVLLVYVRNNRIIGSKWGFRLIAGAFFSFCAICVAFLGLGVADYLAGVS